MPWLKCTPVFSHGYGAPEYEELPAVAPGDDVGMLQEAQRMMREEHADPEGYREPIWEIVDAPPKEVLEAKIKEALDRQQSWAREYSRLLAHRIHHYPPEP